MNQKNSSIEANLAAAKSAARQMQAEWARWRVANEIAIKHECQAKYAAAFTSCKVYIENYLKHLFPDEKRVPQKIAQDIRNIVADMEAIDRMNEGMIQQIFRHIDQLSRDAA